MSQKEQIAVVTERISSAPRAAGRVGKRTSARLDDAVAARGSSRALVHASVLALALTSGACSTPPQEAAHTQVTLAPTMPTAGKCAPDQLISCVPGLADFDTPLFRGVNVEKPSPQQLFAALPAPGATPETGQCAELSRMGADDHSELDVSYLPVQHDQRGAEAHLFATETEIVRMRIMTAGAGTGVVAGMADWIRQCPTWAIADAADDHGVKGWLLAQSADILSRYQAGDIAGQWRNVFQVAAAELPNGVIVQIWYRTDDPSKKSRQHTLTEIVAAAGRPRPRSGLPARFGEWNSTQLSSLLPPLTPYALTRVNDGERAQFQSSCDYGNADPVPPYRILASWADTDPTKWKIGPLPPQPEVSIGEAQPGVDYLWELRREIAACTTHAAAIPADCSHRPDQFLQSDSALTDGEDTLRITHRWSGVENVQAYNRCVERIETLRVTQTRGLLVISRAANGVPKQSIGDAPALPDDVLDELHADVVRNIKRA